MTTETRNLEASTMARYTHRIHFTVALKGTLRGLSVPQSFPTTADAVAIHVRALKARRDVSGVRVESFGA